MDTIFWTMILMNCILNVYYNPEIVWLFGIKIMTILMFPGFMGSAFLCIGTGCFMLVGTFWNRYCKELQFQILTCTDDIYRTECWPFLISIFYNFIFKKHLKNISHSVVQQCHYSMVFLVGRTSHFFSRMCWNVYLKSSERLTFCFADSWTALQAFKLWALEFL